MDDLFLELVASLREGQGVIDAEVQLLLHAENPDRSMLARLRDVANDYAERARQLRQMMTEGSTDEAALEEVNRLCAYFDGTAGLISQETGNTDAASTTGVEDGAGRG